MSELEEKLGSLLSNPQMMQQIMSMAQMFSGEQQPQAEKKAEEPPPSGSSIDPKLLKALSGLSKQGGMDQNQQGLLKALQPYLSTEKIHKLERAMSAARMASAASAFLGAGGLQFLTSR